MSAHLCAAVANFRILEIEADDVPWKDELVTVAPKIENGELLLPAGPGWGTEVNEEAVRAPGEAAAIGLRRALQAFCGPVPPCPG